MLTIKDKIKQRVIDISYDKKLSHIGSCLTAVEIIYDIYNLKNSDDIFVLSQGHAGLALYVVLEYFYPGINAELLFDKHGVHPSRDIDNKIYCSSGSLGHGLPISLGMAMANTDINVHCLISDGEFAEGSIFESLMIANKYQIKNLTIHVNCNGYSAYDRTNIDLISAITKQFDLNIKLYLTKCLDVYFMKGLSAHYHVLDKDDYNEIREKINEN